MSSLIRAHSNYDLTTLDLHAIEISLVKKLKGRVQEAYVFGSFALGKVKDTSDIDLILVCDTKTKFTERALAFTDLFEVYPSLDILVYTPNELAAQLRETSGFWSSVKSSLKRIL